LHSLIARRSVKMSTHGKRGTRTGMFCWVLFAVSTVLSCAADAAPPPDMVMVTGLPEGAYFRFGNDIKEMAAKEGLTMEVKATGGSFDNIQLIASRENAGFGIVQADVLGVIRRDPKYGQALADRLRVIFPFHLEQVHILAGPGIQTLADLDGKRVSVGPKGGGSRLTAENISSLMHIRFLEAPPMTPKDAVDKLLEGKLDALFFVAGAPFPAFDRLKEMWKFGGPSERAAVSRLHFLPVSRAAYPLIFNDYVESSIRAKTYDWLGIEVPVAAVPAILIGYDFSGNKSAYFQKRCNQLATLGKAIRDHLGELQAKAGHYHPKWSEVTADRSKPVPGWQYDACSQP
jgi:uncharacterized protein